jgi:peptidoglycan/LPS O-acetylase OafA/YrhL
VGILRLFLAVSVVIAHSSAIFGLTLMPSDEAVKLFFMISGFYMSLVLSGKYQGNGKTWLFYSNRFLRLYPAYVVALVLTTGLLVAAEFTKRPVESSQLVKEISHRFTGESGELSNVSLAAVIVPNLTLFGSDLLFLFHHSRASGWHFTLGQNANVSDPTAQRTGRFLLISPAWSIGIELWFYLLVPVLARARTGVIVAIAVASMALRLWMDSRLPWSSYFFFPAALCFFAAGMLAHRFWASALFRRVGEPWMVWTIAIGALALLFGREFIPGFRNYSWMHYSVAGCGIAFIFQATKSIKVDRWIGNLSYPVYLLHAAAIIVARNYFHSDSGAFVLLMTLAFALAVNVFLEEPLERVRQRRAAKGAPTVDAVAFQSQPAQA